jgi:hypothetical protein
MKDLRERRVAGSHRWLATGWSLLLKDWMDLLSEFEDTEHDAPLDVAYWYGERALTGTLATAVWRNKRPRRWALEEFLGLRVREGKKRASGRGDLWVGLGQDGKRPRQASFTIEAKTSFMGRGLEGIIDSIEAKLKAAKAQLASLDPEYSSGYPMAVCYHIPAVLNRDASRRTSREIFRPVAEMFQRQPDTIVGAYWRGLANAPIHDKWHYPGVILVGRVFPRLRGWPRTFEPW